MIRTVVVLSTECDPTTLKFPVMLDGTLCDVPLDFIKHAIREGADVREQESKR